MANKKAFSVDMNDERINPAVTFVTPESQMAENPVAVATPTGEHSVSSKTTQEFSFVIAEEKEKRNRRVILMVTPTMYKRLKATAEKVGQSMNEVIVQSLDYTLMENIEE